MHDGGDVHVGTYHYDVMTSKIFTDSGRHTRIDDLECAALRTSSRDTPLNHPLFGLSAGGVPHRRHAPTGAFWPDISNTW